jgi:hypothetical protein
LAPQRINMALLAGIERALRQSSGFSLFNITRRDLHENFADQTDAVGIGASRRDDCWSSRLCTFLTQAFCIQDLST